MAPSGPTVHRRQLGAELRRLREAAGLRLEEVAPQLGCSQARLSRIETGGRATAKPDDVCKLCELYGITEERQVQMLLDMLTSSQEKGWWESYDDVLPSGLEVYVGLESSALAERAWEPQLIHGLLQTPDYARAVFTSWHSNRPDQIDSLVEVRTERQKVLDREGTPLDYWAILDEGTLRRPVGGPEVMRDQLNHLIEASALPNVTLQVLPIAKGSHPGLAGPFSLLEFEDNTPVVYAESQVGNLYVEKVRDVRRFTTIFDRFRAMALDTDDTTTLIQRTIKELFHDH
jgi:transcriptional regulator with XRE-family HTH domain